MNMFLKGLHNFPHIIERVIDKSPMDYYGNQDGNPNKDTPLLPI